MLHYRKSNKWYKCARILIILVTMWSIAYFLNIVKINTGRAGKQATKPLKTFASLTSSYESIPEVGPDITVKNTVTEQKYSLLEGQIEQLLDERSPSNVNISQENNYAFSTLSEVTNILNSDDESGIVDEFIPTARREEMPTTLAKQTNGKADGDNYGLGRFYKLIQGIQYDAEDVGEMGKSYTASSEVERRFKENEFNVVVSEHISLNRSLPNVAPSACQKIIYPQQLPTCTVVIVFYNEAWSTLLRSVHSVLNRSPAHLLKEIILIDDASDRDHLKEPLEKYLRNFASQVKLKRLPERSGLIVARLEGAKIAQGDVLLFLDAHIEVTPGWLEPLLSRIHTDRTIVASPLVDTIDDKTFEYIRMGKLSWGGFTWSLNFRWYSKNSILMRNRSSTDLTSPYQTPTIVGGLFAIDRNYFWNIGSYDEDMKVWGGENMEISFRVWMCGGSLEMIPCSRVGHVFRDASPYKHGNKTFTASRYNSARVAEVWMDEYKVFFYSLKGGTNSSYTGDVSGRRALRQKLGCKSFRWYLENIIPAGTIPVSYYSLGTIINDQIGMCIYNKRQEKVPPELHRCSGKNYHMIWSYTSDNQVRNDEFCLGFSSKSGVFAKLCKSVGQSSKWEYDNQNKWLRHKKSGQCLTAVERSIVLQSCQSGQMAQSWTLHGYDGQLKPKTASVSEST